MLYYNVQYHDDNELENETKDLLLKICDKAVTKDIMMYKIIKSVPFTYFAIIFYDNYEHDKRVGFAKYCK